MELASCNSVHFSSSVHISLRKNRGRVLSRSSASSRPNPTPRVSRITAASTTNGAAVSGAVTRTLTVRTDNGEVLRPGNSSSALEQLDIERGVCVPFRKYTPETVRSSEYWILSFCCLICSVYLDCTWFCRLHSSGLKINIAWQWTQMSNLSPFLQLRLMILIRFRGQSRIFWTKRLVAK